MAELAAYVEYVMPRARGREEPRSTKVDQSMMVYVGFVYGTAAHRWVQRATRYIGVADEQMATESGPGGRTGRHEATADNDWRRATAWVAVVT